MMVEIKNIIKKYNNINAVNNVSLEVNQGDLLALLGPSGCGKTTLLRIIAGLAKPDSGRILINGKDITNLPPQKRNTALVFQSYALFPHLNVAENIAYGLKNKDLSKKVINQKLQQIADIIELKGLLNRQIFELSGGQQQRVALARALVLEPDILCLMSH
ncbi:ABC transporter ATP-binding protein [Clostridium sp. 'deep sea']|uniref:ABC transporter ATP-binding protein n=1 Tax=Clostridium sp. 'deep sea' TaxID=2779445 RepID=UPI0018966341|nr:ABC transporter ATP-binding protein [Clostridium sp. 'deep sea']QOR36850.1 ABC transporter ATP-binding protein [Clostridium sp. 'deep sea']